MSKLLKLRLLKLASFCKLLCKLAIAWNMCTCPCPSCALIFVHVNVRHPVPLPLLLYLYYNVLYSRQALPCGGHGRTA